MPQYLFGQLQVQLSYYNLRKMPPITRWLLEEILDFRMKKSIFCVYTFIESHF